MKHLIIRDGANGHNTFAIPGTDEIDVYYGDAAASTVTVPPGANYVVYSATDDFYVRWDGTAAAIPGADITNGTGSEINPTIRDIKGVTSFSIIAAVDTVVTMAFYK
jgi:hypothetical protein